MQTPYRKPGKFSHIKPDPEITQAKFDELASKLDRLKNKTRFKAMEEVRIQAENGDFSENASYQIAKGRLRSINQRILDLENQLKVAVIIKTVKNPSTVAIGTPPSPLATTTKPKLIRFSALQKLILVVELSLTNRHSAKLS
jgi:hypothetical protein